MNLFLLLPPLLAAGVALMFASRLLRQWRARRHHHALAWALSLVLFAVASLAAGVGVFLGWSSELFGVYWIAGALLNVPILAVGQLLLMDRSRAVLWWTLAGLFTVSSVVFTATAGHDAGVLAQASSSSTIPLGREVLDGSTAYALARPFSGTFVVVVAGSIYSAMRSRRVQVLLIALGVSVVAGSSSAVRVGNGEVFAALLTIGVTIMYVGFLAASRSPRPRPEFPGVRRGVGRGEPAEAGRAGGQRTGA